MKKHTINVKKKTNDVMGQEDGLLYHAATQTEDLRLESQQTGRWMVLMAASLPAW